MSMSILYSYSKNQCILFYQNLHVFDNEGHERHKLDSFTLTDQSNFEMYYQEFIIQNFFLYYEPVL